ALGFIGSTDSHTGLASAEEDNFHGKMALDSTPERKQAQWGDDAGPSGWSMSAAGLAAVWAESNTREAIIDAMRRKEVYATTGPRIALQMYALASDQQVNLDSSTAVAELRALAAPMGSTLSADGRAEFRLAIMATQDPVGEPLERVQVVKGWIDADGNTHEQVIDVEVASAVGTPAFSVIWSDPSFDPEVSAFYYARVLQVPSERHSSLDARALELADSGFPEMIQERAYSSPIWYR
ncbi:MAG: DUF3604 domain-containing protein, partial [Proteobacteria bacterium]|nr:DUF3604 domain-containing protein [Pseudomonadota bacterium]